MDALRAMRAVVNRFGVDVVAFRPERQLYARRRRAFRDGGVTLVLDAGANAGQYASRLRQQGYGGRIVSFEPLGEAFARLERVAAADATWEVQQLALGDSDGKATINVAGNSESSSLLPMTATHESEAPESVYVSTEIITVRRLDSVRPHVVQADDRIHLKLDVQGLELSVLRGAEATLEQIVSIECELSLVPLYEGQALIEELVGHLARAGFALVAVEPAYATAAGHVIQLDGLFARTRSYDARVSAARDK
jgi:FkbM family methyltransferase